jgi:penicillin-binding protein 1A
MASAHTSMDIPQLPGLSLHPRQVEERQRLSEIRRDDPTLGTGVTDAAKRMPAKTKKVLTSLSKLLKDAQKLQGGAAPSEKGASLDKPLVRTQ